MKHILENISSIITFIGLLNTMGSIAIISQGSHNKNVGKTLATMYISSIFTIFSLLIFENKFEESYNKNIVEQYSENQSLNMDNVNNVYTDMSKKFDDSLQKYYVKYIQN